MKHKLTIAMMTLLVAIGLSSGAVYADTLTFTLNNPSQSANPGDTVTYTATVFAPASNSAALYLNGDSYNLDSPIVLDDSGFFSNFPFFLNPGDTFTGDLFALNIPTGTSLGSYFGSFSLIGGADDFTVDSLSSADFSIAATPEPASFVLLGSGLAGLAGLIRRKRRA